MLIEELGKRTRIDTQHLKQQMKRPPAAAASASTSTPIVTSEMIVNHFPAPLRLALALIIQYPRLAQSIDKPLPPLTHAGFTLLTEIIEIINRSPHITTGGIHEQWRDKPAAAVIAQLAHWQHHIPEEGIESEFLGAIRQLTLASYDAKIDHLLSKSAQQGLSTEEKQLLATWISKKKSPEETH
jgi:DNA primase